MQFDKAEGTAWFPGYPYGDILFYFYYGSYPSELSVRVYCNYESQGIGWKTLSINKSIDNLWTAHNAYYGISKIEITIKGNGIAGDQDSSGKYSTRLTQIEMALSRPGNQITPIISRYQAETLYYPLTVPELIEGGTTL